jgi:hypothetical protein
MSRFVERLKEAKLRANQIQYRPSPVWFYISGLLAAWQKNTSGRRFGMGAGLFFQGIYLLERGIKDAGNGEAA